MKKSNAHDWLSPALGIGFYDTLVTPELQSVSQKTLYEANPLIDVSSQLLWKAFHWFLIKYKNDQVFFSFINKNEEGMHSLWLKKETLVQLMAENKDKFFKYEDPYKHVVVSQANPIPPAVRHVPITLDYMQKALDAAEYVLKILTNPKIS